MKYHPGPKKIDKGEAPGGIVIHVYDMKGERLIRRALESLEDTDTAEDDAAFVAGMTWGCVVVAYDGDTGRRFRQTELLEVLK